MFWAGKVGYGHNTWFHLLNNFAVVLFPVIDVTEIPFELGAQCYENTGDTFKVIDISLSR